MYVQPFVPNVFIMLRRSVSSGNNELLENQYRMKDVCSVFSYCLCSSGEAACLLFPLTLYHLFISFSTRKNDDFVCIDSCCVWMALTVT